jgi:hypothetical protein
VRWRRWLAFLDQKEAGTTLALARIAFGLVTFGTVLSLIVRGLVPALFMAPADGGILSVGGSPMIYDLFGGRTPFAVWSLIGLELALSAALTIGIGGRITAFATLQVFMWTIGLNGTANASHTLLITNALWLLVLGDSTATWSLDARLRRGKLVTDVQIAAWPRRLMIVQIVIVYFMAGVHKVSAHWLPIGDASAIYYILRAPNWSTMMDADFIVRMYPVTQLMTIGTWLFEVTSPLVLIWYRLVDDPQRPGRLAALARRCDWRIVFIGVGLGMHVGIELTMNVGPFSYAAIAYYIALVRPHEWRGMLARVSALRLRLLSERSR